MPRIQFPSAPAKAGAFRAAMLAKASSRPEMIALDRLEAALQNLGAEKKGEALPLKNDPPRILFSSVPAILVLVDGEPSFRPTSRTRGSSAPSTRARFS